MIELLKSLFKPVKNRNLIIAAVGDDSLHTYWIDNPKIQNFDLMLIYYGDTPGRYEKDALYYIEKTGYKYHLIHDAVAEHEEEIKEYDAIWCPDDDLLADTSELNKMFDIFIAYNLNVAQPSLTKDSFHSLSITMNDPKNVLRYTNVVEVMAPIFNQSTFQIVRRTFKETFSGWGFDWVWPKLVGYKRCGIIDAVRVKHTRPPRTGGLYKKYREDGVMPTHEKNYVLNRYSVEAVCAELDRISATRQVTILPDNLGRLSRPFRRDNKCSTACKVVGSRLMDIRKLINN